MLSSEWIRFWISHDRRQHHAIRHNDSATRTNSVCDRDAHPNQHLPSDRRLKHQYIFFFHKQTVVPVSLKQEQPSYVVI